MRHRLYPGCEPHAGHKQSLRRLSGDAIRSGRNADYSPPPAQIRTGHTAPILGGDGKTNAWPWVKDLGLGEEVSGQLCHPFLRKAVLLTAAPQRAQPEARHMVAKGAEHVQQCACTEAGPARSPRQRGQAAKVGTVMPSALAVLRLIMNSTFEAS